MAQTVFKVFDEDSSGSLDFIEYMQAGQQSLNYNVCLNILVAGTPGTPTQDNRRETGQDFLYHSISDRRMIQACVMDVKRSVDRDNDGTITKEEFIENARQG